MNIESAQTGASLQTMKKAMETQKLGAQLITQTLQNMNQNQLGSGVNADYDFQTKVLMAGAVGKGGNLNTMV